MTALPIGPRPQFGQDRAAVYCVGFLFDDQPHSQRVLLIEKQKPVWMRGLYNGIGGKLRVGEAPRFAMRREFKEETGLDLDDWDLFATLKGPDFYVSAYSKIVTVETFNRAQTQEEEILSAVMVADLTFLPLVANLRVLIPLALDTSGIRKPVHFIDEVSAASLPPR